MFDTTLLKNKLIVFALASFFKYYIIYFVCILLNKTCTAYHHRLSDIPPPSKTKLKKTITFVLC